MSASSLNSQSQVQTLAADETSPSARAVPTRLGPGTLVDERFHVLRVLGAGAMGVVYEAIDLTLDRRVAIKLHRAHGKGDRDGRMLREAKAMARLTHPNVLTVHQVGLHDGGVYIAMELVEGGTVREWLSSPRSWREVVALFLQAARGLAAAHEQGLTHRDFKPDNMLLGADGRVRVADFGLARASGGEEPVSLHSLDGVAPRLGSIDAHVSRTRGVAGTPAYAAPEQVADQTVDPRSDQFSFCVSFYEALWGERPFHGETLVELYVASSEGRMRTPDSGVEVPSWVRAIVERGLRPDPADRFPDMLALATALESDPTRRRRRALAAVGGVALLGLTAWGSWVLASKDSPCDRAGAAIEAQWGADHSVRIGERVREVAPTIAEDTLASVDPRLDAYASAWQEQRVEACRSTLERGEQSAQLLDLRIECLDRRAAELGSVVAELELADAEAVVHADDLLASLAPLSACADTDALRAHVPLPDDPQQREAVVAVRNASAELLAAVAAGRGDRQEERAAELLERALALGNVTAEADAQLAWAAVQWALDRHDEARASWVATHRAAVSVGHARAAYESARQLALAVARTKKGADAALDWLAVAEGWGRPAQLTQDDWAELALARASVLLGAERYDEIAPALVLGTEADPSPATQSRMAMLRAKALHRLGRFDEAEQAAVAAIALARSAHGPRHPKLGTALEELANVQLQRGQLDEAIAAYHEVIHINEGVYGERSSQAAGTRGLLANARLAKGDEEQALLEYERALATLGELSTPDPVMEAIVQANYADALARVGRRPEAVKAGEQALALGREAYGDDSSKVAQMRINLGNAYHAVGQSAEGVRQYEEGLGVLETALGPDHPSVGILLLNLGIAQLALDRLDAADESIMRGARLFERRNDPGSSWPARSWSARARLADARGDRAMASEYRGRAVQAYETLAREPTAELREAVYRHGRAMLAAERAEEAIVVLERAEALAQEVPTSEAEQAEILGQLARAQWATKARRGEALATARRALGLAEGVEELRVELVEWIADPK